MFYKEEINGKYYVYSDKSKGKFGPFDGAFVKNNFVGDFPDEAKDLTEDFQDYKYSIGISSGFIYLMNEEEMFNIIKL